MGVSEDNLVRAETNQILNVVDLIIPQMPWISDYDSLTVEHAIFP